MRMDRLFGGASHYAHLAALVPLRGRRAEEDDKKDDKSSKRADAEEDDEDKDKSSKRSRAEDNPDDDKGDPKDGKRSRAEDGDDDDDKKDAKRSRAEGDEDDDDDDKKDAKRSRAADDEDDDDDKDEMTGKSASARARRRERARCAAIFAHPSAAANVQLACDLAFETTMTRKEAIKVLKGQASRPAASREVGEGRSARNPRIEPGGGENNGQQAVTSSWDRALAKAGVPTRK